MLLGYIAGSRSSPDWDRERSEAQARVMLDLSIYQLLQQGNVSRAQGQVSMRLLGETRDYQHLFGVPSGTDVFALRFAQANSLANQIESTLVPVSSIGTNLGSNVTVKFE